MTDQPAPAPPLYGVAPAPGGGVTIDVTYTAVTRLVELLDRRPALLGALADASGHGRNRANAVTYLHRNRDVREACRLRLDQDAAVALAADLIDATGGPAAGRRVGAGPDRGPVTPAHGTPALHGRTDR